MSNATVVFPDQEPAVEGTHHDDHLGIVVRMPSIVVQTPAFVSGETTAACPNEVEKTNNSSIETSPPQPPPTPTVPHHYEFPTADLSIMPVLSGLNDNASDNGREVGNQELQPNICQVQIKAFDRSADCLDTSQSLILS